MLNLTEIKRRVSALEAAQKYGLEFDRTGKRARCIWHPDRHPSLSFKGSFCHCFSCGNGGSCLDVAMRVFHVDVSEAALIINRDFELGMPVNANIPYNSETHKASLRAAVLRDQIAVLKAYLRDNGPRSAGEAISNTYAECVAKLEAKELELEELHGKYRII